MNDINSRISLLIAKISNGNKRQFSLLIGVSATVIENIVGSRLGKPSFDVLEKIIYAIENINVDWLITGRGEIFNNKDTLSSIPSDADHLMTLIREKDIRIEDLSRLIGKLEYQYNQLKQKKSPYNISNNAGAVCEDPP